MYAPELYRSEELAQQHGLIEAHPFGMLTATVDGRPHGTHIPFVLDRGQGSRGRLRAHLAKVNPVVPVLAEGAEVMAAFVGPHAYICPDDYATETHFPTWNYAAVHVYGRPRLLDPEEEFRQLEDLIAAEEARRLPKEPWTLDRVPRELVERFRTMIVAFELPIDRIDAIFKFGQNKKEEDVVAQIDSFRSRPFDSAAHFADQLHTHNAERLG
ncbi:MULTISPECIES: FMN-binding negative transcriptional regulator [unclassified Streptomyces]|uniref:FMN-binding negative transcriptional regulator n=1 Tax=unclassified Streptomyces TaxID=2593676 RepID=UPI000DACBCC0|nr:MULTISPECIES: FMN-binding negative transcriptional regulator [unclassified Streptomyces]PZT76131.1 FMN-binding negative transcriptional regulator [Streptomyces sp. AC1-42W]PZT79917.1 FMN-binding negative transcriptional regulator [Streptomyces sp. AC1-42T]